jgi:hypothetical protein
MSLLLQLDSSADCSAQLVEQIARAVAFFNLEQIDLAVCPVPPDYDDACLASLASVLEAQVSSGRIQAYCLSYPHVGSPAPGGYTQLPPTEASPNLVAVQFPLNLMTASAWVTDGGNGGAELAAAASARGLTRVVESALDAIDPLTGKPVRFIGQEQSASASTGSRSTSTGPLPLTSDEEMVELAAKLQTSFNNVLHLERQYPAMQAKALQAEEQQKEQQKEEDAELAKRIYGDQDGADVAVAEAADKVKETLASAGAGIKEEEVAHGEKAPAALSWGQILAQNQERLMEGGLHEWNTIRWQTVQPQLVAALRDLGQGNGPGNDVRNEWSTVYLIEVNGLFDSFTDLFIARAARQHGRATSALDAMGDSYSDSCSDSWAWPAYTDEGTDKKTDEKDPLPRRALAFALSTPPCALGETIVLTEESLTLDFVADGAVASDTETAAVPIGEGGDEGSSTRAQRHFELASADMLLPEHLWRTIASDFVWPPADHRA